MKLEAGKYYKTRDGRKAYVAARINVFSAQARWPYIGVIAGKPDPFSWMENGAAFDDHSEWDERDVDLVAEWKEPVKVEGWVAIGDNGGVTSVYDTQDKVSQLFPFATAYIYVTGIEGEEP